MREKTESKRKAALYLIHEFLKNRSDVAPNQRGELLYFRGVALAQAGAFTSARTVLEEASILRKDDYIVAKRLEEVTCQLFASQYKEKKFDISYIMPVYNPKIEHLDLAVQSVLQQKGKYKDHTDLIIIDDGSIENIQEYIEQKYASEVSLGKIKVARKQNGGTASTRNLGLRIALSGEKKYITFLDGDDIAAPDRTEKLASYLDSHPTISFVHARADTIDQNERPAPENHPATKYFQRIWSELKEGEDSKTPYKLLEPRASAVHAQTTMVRADTIREAGYQNILWRRGQDKRYWQSIAETGARFSFLDDIVAHYRVR